MLTKALIWLETRLEEGAWFRRIYVFLATLLIWRVTVWSMGYAEANASRPGLDVAAIIAAVSAVPGAVVTFAFNQYLSTRGR
jgi:hypothetical protein